MKPQDAELYRSAKRGDREAFAAVLKKNEGFIKSKARKYWRPGIDFDDLAQAGLIGLFKALKRFDPSRGYTFLTFAGHGIEEEIKRANYAAKTVWVPIYKYAEVGKFLKDGKLKKWIGFGRRPDNAEDMRGFSRMISGGISSIDRTLDGSDDGAEIASMLPDYGDGPERRAETVVQKAEVRKLLGRIPRGYAAILRFRYGFDGGPPLSLRAIGRELRISYETVRLKHDMAIDAIRANIEGRQIMPYDQVYKLAKAERRKR